MANGQTADITVTQEAIAQAGVEVIELAGMIHGMQTGQVGAMEYTPEVGQVVLSYIDSIDVPGAGVLTHDALTEERGRLFASAVNQATGGQVSADHIAGLVDQAEINIKALDAAYVQGLRIMPTDEGVALSQNGQEIGSYSIDEINAMRDAQANGASAPATVTRLEPAEEIPADVQERVLRIEQALAKIIPAVNQAFPDVNLPNVGDIDGVFDQKSYDALDAAIGGVTNVLNTSDNPALVGLRTFGTIETLNYDGQFSDDFCEKLQKNLGIALPLMGSQIDDPALKAQLNSVSIPSLIADIEYLRDHDSLKPVEMVEVVVPVNAGVDQGVEVSVDEPQIDSEPAVVSGGTSGADASSEEDNAQQAIGEINEAVISVETMMSLVSSKIDDFDLGPMGDKIASFKDQLIKPINQGDFDEDGQAIFDANSQEMAATLLMVLKTVNGEDNPNGAYNVRIGDQLQADILSKPEFAFLRTELGINGQYTPEEANILMRGEFEPEPFMTVEGESEDAEAARRDAHNTAQEEARVQFTVAAAKLQGSNEEGLRQLNQMFSGMDKLADPEVNMLDPQKVAAEKTKNNLMFDIAGGFLEKTGMLSTVKDFFTNNAIGQFLGSILGMVGFDVNRLWGETGANLENPEELAAKLGDDFESVYKEVEGANPDADFNQIMALTKEETLDGMNGFWAKNTLNIAIGSEDADMLRAAAESALDEAAKAGNMEAAKAVFVENMENFAEAYKGNDATITIAGQEYTKADHTLASDLGSLDDALKDLDDGVEVSVPELGANAVNGLNARTVEELDSDAIKLNESQALDTEIVYDTDPKNQDPLRYGNVEAIQRYLYANQDELGLDQENIAEFAVEGADGSVEFTKVLDIETCAAIEEMWVKAKLHDYIVDAQAQNTEITSDMVEGWVQAIDAEKLAKGPGVDGGTHEEFTADLALMQQYAEAHGAAAGFEAVGNNDVVEAEEALLEMDADMQSSADGQTKQFSVLEQSLTWNQVDITKLALEMEAIVEILEEPQQPAVEQPEPVVVQPVEQPEVREEPKGDDNECEDNSCQQALTRLPSLADGRGDQDPKNYRELPLFPMHTQEAEFLRDILLEKDPGLEQRAKDLGQDPIELFAMENKQEGGNQYLLMDLREMGVAGSHTNFDGVMINFEKGHNSNPEFRYYDHSIHEITSLEEHRQNAHNRFERSNPLSPGDADFDTFFSIKERSGMRIADSPSSLSGFRGMAVVSEDLSLKNGYAAVYGDDAYRQELRDNRYTDSYSERAHYYKTDENARYIQEQQNKIAAMQGVSPSQRTQSTNPTQPRQDEFNNKSGCPKEPEFENWGGPQKGMGAWGAGKAVREQFRAIGRMFGGDEEEGCGNEQASITLHQGINDIGGDQFDPSIESGFVPGMDNTSSVGVSRTA